MSEPIQAEWVIARYTSNSSQGKSVLAHIGAGAGYHLLNPQRSKTDDLIVGFRRPIDDARPAHLQLASWEQIRKLERLDSQRNGRVQ